MRNEPEVIKILREEERTGKLYKKLFTTYKELNSTETAPDEILTTSGEYEDIIATISAPSKNKQPKEQAESYQKKTKEQIIELKKRDKIKTNFLSVTSHELRTPISAIKGYLQMLLRQKLGTINEEQKNALNIILRNTNRLDTLIQDILDISRLESGTMKFVPKLTNIKNMIEQAVETMQSSADKKNIKINISLGGNLPDLIVDQERVKQVVANLLANAIKFSHDGSVVNIFVKSDRDHVLFEIQDFGRGIPADNQNKLFEAFYQINSSEDRKLGGMGLGLAISRGIVLAHGGRIWVESVLNKGSSFIFSLPVKPIRDVEGRFKDADIFRLDE